MSKEKIKWTGAEYVAEVAKQLSEFADDLREGARRCRDEAETIQKEIDCLIYDRGIASRGARIASAMIRDLEGFAESCSPPPPLLTIVPDQD